MRNSRHTQITKQRGVVAIFTTFALVSLIGIGALALDVGHLILSKSRLQNLADAAALTAAKTLDQKGTLIDAKNEGNTTIQTNLSSSGFTGLTISFDSVSYEFSEALPFDPLTQTSSSKYVRVKIENIALPEFLSSIFGVTLHARASAVAGPSTSLGMTCNVLPLSICEGDSDSSTLSGYSPQSLHVLKASTSKDSAIGSGNYMAVALQGVDGSTESGAKAYSEALAGNFDSCVNNADGEVITTEPGNMVGPSLAIDTRFGVYDKGNLDPSLYISDIDTSYEKNDPALIEEVTEESDEGESTTTYKPNKTYDEIYNYQKYISNYESNNYQACLGSENCQNKGLFRRVVTVPILKCDQATKSGGRMDIPLKGLGCFFLNQPLSITTTTDNKNGKGDGSWIIGEFIEDCRNYSGQPGLVPDTEGPYKIVLYNDPNSEDS